MHIEYQISEDDYVSACKLGMHKRTKSTIISMYVLPACGVFLVTCCLIEAIIRHHFLTVIAPLIWGLLLSCIPLVWIYQFRKAYRKTPLLQVPRTLEIDDSSLHFTTSDSESRSPWQFFLSFSENDRTFILFQQGNQIFFPIPKRELTPTQITQLRALFEAHIPSK
jgi:hypothetical protein